MNWDSCHFLKQDQSYSSKYSAKDTNKDLPSLPAIYLLMNGLKSSALPRAGLSKEVSFRMNAIGTDKVKRKNNKAIQRKKRKENRNSSLKLEIYFF